MNDTSITLDSVPEEADPIHLLLIADTKMGKSTYVAQAALDGYRIIYVDADNGQRALRFHLRNNPEAMQNVIYLPTKNPYGLVHGLLTEAVFRWNISEDKTFSSGTAKPSSKMIEMRPARIPRGVILCIDSWSSTALDAMELGATANKTTLEDMGNDQQAVYGDAGLKLTLLCAVLQHVKFHCIVLAHGGWYERLEKPLGKQQYKMSEMILREVIKIPLSSSRPHGFMMGKYFNEIGWIELDKQNRTILDYTRQFGRVGGGTPAIADEIHKLSFKNTFQRGPIECPPLESDWIKVQLTQDWLAENKPAAKAPATPAGASDGVLPAKPAATSISALMLKKK